MALLTQQYLTSTLDVPIALPATELRQGDWLVVASVKAVSPMKLRFRLLNLGILSSSVTVSQISNSNRVYGNLGLVYVALRKDYSGESPGSAGALDVFAITAEGVYTRPDTLLELTDEGTYSWVVANNMQASDSSTIPASTSIDFRVSVSGVARVEME